MKRTHELVNGSCSNGTGVLEDERDVKPVVKMNHWSTTENKFFSLYSKDRVKLTNLNNQSYQSNASICDDNGRANTSQGDVKNKVKLPADRPILGDRISSGPNWILTGLICYTLGNDINFHLQLKMSPGSHNRDVNIILTFGECAKANKDREFARDVQKYLVSAKLIGKDRSSVLATGSTLLESANAGSCNGLNNRIDSFCSLEDLKSADQLHTYKIPTAKDGNKSNHKGEFDTVELEVDLQAIFKIPNFTNYLKPFACFQSFQPENLFRKTEFPTETYTEVESAAVASTSTRPRWYSATSENSSRYKHIVVLRVGSEQEELYAYRSTLTGCSPKLKQELAATNILEFPNLLPEVVVLFLDLVEEHRNGINSANGRVPDSFQNVKISTICEALKLIKEYQISLPSPLIEKLVSNISHTLASAFKIYSWGQEFGLKELMQSGIRYFKEHKEELRQDQNKKMMEKRDPHLLVSIFSDLL